MNRTAPGVDGTISGHFGKPSVSPHKHTALHTLPVYMQVPYFVEEGYDSASVQEGDLHNIGNYHPICLLSAVYKLFTRVILSRIDGTVDKEQP
ncbi:unnamed protein product [Angiostrongylus costaricensis]|uniref:HDAC8 n=1 Tax=Angiostrongylus costaricensis TaxID=334426 RepID=A0A0R3PNH7_ANGCS|nr:unnamed protein product [Angiostrongylus costaricensis]